MERSAYLMVGGPAAVLVAADLEGGVGEGAAGGPLLRFQAGRQLTTEKGGPLQQLHEQEPLAGMAAEHGGGAAGGDAVELLAAGHAADQERCPLALGQGNGQGVAGRVLQVLFSPAVREQRE
jgi:hypothetical protein